MKKIDQEYLDNGEWIDLDIPVEKEWFEKSGFVMIEGYGLCEDNDKYLFFAPTTGRTNIRRVLKSEWEELIEEDEELVEMLDLGYESPEWEEIILDVIGLEHLKLIDSDEDYEYFIETFNNLSPTIYRREK